MKKKLEVSGFSLLLALGLVSVQAFAFSSVSPPFTGATDFITDFPSCVAVTTAPLSLGPIGLLFDGVNFFAADACNAITYRFTAAGGSALTPDAQRLNGIQDGLLLKDGVYYGGSSIPPIPNVFPGQGIYKFDPNTLSNLGAASLNFPAFASSPPFPPNFPNSILQIVGDPLSTDLYVSTFSGIYRVQNPNSGSPTVTQVMTTFLDGMAFTQDGTILYGAENGANTVAGFDRTFSAPVFSVNVGHPPDGIAVALNNTVLGGVNTSNNVFANTNDGDIVRIDVNNGNAVSVVASGGSRGDFATVGPDNCLYVTQSDRIEKMSPCFFQASNALPSPKFVIGDLNATVGQHVTFWGSQWTKANSLTGGNTPAAFKGFTSGATGLTCGGSWSTGPGNSSNPPNTIPPVIAVIASSSITKSGSSISGNAPKIVVVKTDPGYGPAPGHTGTGTVIGVLCGS